MSTAALQVEIAHLVYITYMYINDITNVTDDMDIMDDDKLCKLILNSIWNNWNKQKTLVKIFLALILWPWRGLLL
jgi:hypothetical protein